MPTVARLGGITIHIYFEDENPPHVHVIQAEHEAKVNIRSRAIIAGEVPTRALDRACAWIEENEQHLLRRWDEYQ